MLQSGYVFLMEKFKISWSVQLANARPIATDV